MPELPERYREFLLKRGGRNLFGGANFILNWGSAPLVRLAVPDEFRNPYTDCWALCDWVAPEEFGARELWDERFFGLFPSEGGYDPRFVFRDENGPAMLDSDMLNLNTLEIAVWVILNHKHDSLSKRVQLLKDDATEKKAAETRRLVELIEEGAPAFLDGVSFSGQLNCNSAIRQKMEQLERNLGHITKVAKRFSRGGMAQAPAPKSSMIYVPADV